MNEESLFQEALSRPSAERAAFLAQACAGQSELRAAVEALLAAHERSGNVLDQLPAAPGETVDSERGPLAPAGSPRMPDPLCTSDPVAGAVSTDEFPRAADGPGSDLPVVPGYRVLREIARGGMGRVLAAYDFGLDRDVALKVLLPGAQANRFVRESKITARLPHPGIPPVYALGTLADGSPFLAMKLVAGHTLAGEMKTADRPRLVQAFLQVCQAVGFAHSRGILHRDLKPSNVMVGAFGEVQVMDWGLAKVVKEHGGRRKEEKGASDGSSSSFLLPPSSFQTDPNQTADERGAGESTDERTQAGTVLGTPSYMAPEQARGEATDARADVFALGGILCALLTGHPPFAGKTARDVIRRAGAADLAEALVRLDGCGADAELVRLCRRCLSPKPSDRPADGQAVADGLTAYLGGVQEKLRRAELAEAAARAKAAEEAKRRRVTLALAATVLLAVTLAGGAWLWWKTDRDVQRARVTSEVTEALHQAASLRERAKGATVGSAALFAQAREQAQRARALVENGPAEPALAEQVRRLHAELDEEEKDRTLVPALDEAQLAQAETLSENRFAWERAVPKFREAFRIYGLPVGEGEPAAAAARIRQRPAAVQEAILAALDEWDDLAGTRITEPHREWLRAVRAAVKPEDPWGRQLRAALAERDDARRRAALAQLATDVDKVPARTLTRLAKQFDMMEAHASAVQLLRRAQAHYPADFWINHGLGLSLLKDKAKPEQQTEAVRFLTAAVALRPESAGTHLNLGAALGMKGQVDEAIACFNKAIVLDPKYAGAHTNLGTMLARKGQWDEAIACIQKAIAIDPKDAVAHNNLGTVLEAKGQVDEAIACYRKAIAIDPDVAMHHRNLGNALMHKGQVDEAIACYRKAIALDPKDAAHIGLGNALLEKRQLDEAIGCFQEAIKLDPKSALAHSNLGAALSDKGQVDEAIAWHKKAIALDPKYAGAHYHLGRTLKARDQLDEAIACFQEAIKLDPKVANAHLILGNALRDKGQADEAIACYQKALALEPKLALAYRGLGRVLLDKGRYVEARDATARALELFPDQDPLRPSVSQQLQTCERHVKLEARLPRLLTGEDRPSSAEAGLELGMLCYHKRMYAAAARFAAAALATDPKLADDLKAQHRYCAACYAALAGAGQGKDAGELDDKQRNHLRQQALDWFKADLVLWRKQLQSGGPADRAIVERMMKHWQTDPDGASIRDKEALTKLPPEERAAWEKLWAHVAALRKMADQQPQSAEAGKQLPQPGGKKVADQDKEEAVKVKLATEYLTAGKKDQALPFLVEVFNSKKARLGPDHPDTLESMNQLGVVYWQLGQLDKSVPLFESLVKSREAILGRDHPETLGAVANLGVNYKDAGKFKEAIGLLEEALGAAQKRPKLAKLAWVVNPLLDAYARAGENAKLANLLQEVLPAARKALPADSPQLAGLLAQSGLALLNLKKWAEAESLIRECLTIREKTQPDVWMTFNTQSMLGGALLGQKKYADAELLLLKGYEGMKQRAKTIAPPGKDRLPEAVERLVQLYEATGKKEEAARWRTEEERYTGKLVGPVHEVGVGLELKGRLDAQTPALAYQVKFAAGKTYVIAMVSPDQKALDPYLFLHDAVGKKLAEDDDSGGGFNARIVFRAEQDSTYRIRATSFNGGSGGFTLTVREQPMQPRKEKD